ncbi:14914_t:CDS:2 [Entrophospora sp. SA101]|nr:14914_t:CDS:2 [Entrophospora sp. SA101]CAJ0841909.1 7046_t:CDS:2 [Entrophospora sp. SA101]
MIKRTFIQFEISDLKEQDIYIIQLFTKTCMFSNDDIIKGDQLYENKEEFKKYVVTICTMVQLNHVDSKYLINLLQEITNSPNRESSSINKLWYYGINVVMNGLINLSWCEDDVNTDNIIDGNNSGATTLANAMINSCFIDCQIFDENFMRIFNNPVIVKQLPNLIIKEIQRSVDMDDNGFNILNEKVTIRFLQLFENSRKEKANEASHIFWEILNRLRSPKIRLISDNEKSPVSGIREKISGMEITDFEAQPESQHSLTENGKIEDIQVESISAMTLGYVAKKLVPDEKAHNAKMEDWYGEGEVYRRLEKLYKLI